MIRDLNETNRMPFVYDLTPDEDKFYRGTGKATIVVDVANNIIACLYDTEYMTPREGEEAALIAAMAQAGTKWMEGTMSCYQFCCQNEGRLNG